MGVTARKDARLDQVADYLIKHEGNVPSYSEIGQRLGCTKSAISGAIGRLRKKGFAYCPEPKYIIKPIFGPFLPKHKPKPKREREQIVQRIPTPFRKHRPTQERVRGGCQYIPGEPSADDSCKCLAERLEGSSYCPKHDELCYQRKAA